MDTDFFNQPLTLIVHPQIAELERICSALSVHFPVVSIGVGLSLALDENESLNIQDWFLHHPHLSPQLPTLLSEADILFHPSLHLDPIQLFRIIAHAFPIMVLIPGTYENGTLAYAEPSHAHYRTWRDLSDMTIITGGLHAISRLGSI
jgi:hypothetical protein